MTYTYDLRTDIGKVRLHAQDNVEASAAFTDEELQVYLDDHGGDLYQAAAAALDALAANKAKLAERAKTNDGSERDLTAVAREVREAAAALARRGGGGMQVARMLRPDQATVLGISRWR